MIRSAGDAAAKIAAMVPAPAEAAPVESAPPRRATANRHRSLMFANDDPSGLVATTPLAKSVRCWRAFSVLT